MQSSTILSALFVITIVPIGVYINIIGVLAQFPYLQNHAFYLHKADFPWNYNHLNAPEYFGFLPKQVTPFSIQSRDNETLHAWHILPPALHQRREKDLISDQSGYADDITTRKSFKLLKEDPQARLLIYLHGTAGSVASAWRPYAYRNLYSGAPDKIHVLSFDYRGFGLSTGSPTEEGLIVDAVSVIDWAIKVAHIPPSRIIVFGQSLGTAVATGAALHYALEEPPVAFAGLNLVSSFSDVPTVLRKYKLGGYVPLLGPVAMIPGGLESMDQFIENRWHSDLRMEKLVRTLEAKARKNSKYHISIMHSEDDPEVPCEHSDTMFWAAVNGTTEAGVAFEALQEEKLSRRANYGEGGWATERRTKKGVIRQEMSRYGSHDLIMTQPITAMAVLRAFKEADADFFESPRIL